MATLSGCADWTEDSEAAQKLCGKPWQEGMVRCMMGEDRVLSCSTVENKIESVCVWVFIVYLSALDF